MYQELNQVVEQMTAPGQMFEIRESEISGHRMKTWALAPSSLREVWLNSAGHGDADYLVYQDDRWTYTQAHDAVARIANWLTANGIKQHDRVAIAMRNYPEWMLSYWALVAIGAVPVGINAWWVADELRFGLQDSDVQMLICDRERLERFTAIRDDFPELPVVAVRVDEVPDWATPWSGVLQADPAMPEVTIDPDDDACIFYTSGTTGRPKGAQLTHRGCVNNLFSTMFSTLSQMSAAAAAGVEAGDSPLAAGSPQMAAIIATPLFHVTANNCVAQLFTVSGGKLVHLYKWDPAEALRLIEQERVTAFTGVPMMTREMINHPDFETRDTSSLGMLGGGGAPVQPDITEKVMKSGGGARPAQGYGLTETCGAVAGCWGLFQQDKPGSAGRLSPVFDVKCIDSEGNELPMGETGEICLRGPQVIKGYLNRPDATAETIVDGWLRTGDIGHYDADRFIYLVDRAKDMVLRGGENVYCSEVEAALFKHDSVAECVVFAVPDERLGEEVGAAIYPQDGHAADAAQLREFCRSKMAAYKVPRYIWILDTPIPRNASGKFVKRELKDTLRVEDAT